MAFIFNNNTEVYAEINTRPVANAIMILKRDMAKVFRPNLNGGGSIVLKQDGGKTDEDYTICISDKIEIFAKGDLGFIYALLRISAEFLGVKPFWFWLDQPIETKVEVVIQPRILTPQKPAVKLRGWFFNDEVLLMKWKIGGDAVEPWRMAFEALLRCGGNMAIPGTDKMSRANRQLAAEYGLWITHHHAEPLGAEMLARAFPGAKPNYDENAELFHKLWEEAVLEQKGNKVVWNLCFRGQGDNSFWSSDTSGKYDTKEKRGTLIGEIIEKQREIVCKHVENPVFCTNLYGEIMELYSEGFLHLDADIIKVRADNGFGKMVTRRRGSFNPRVNSMPQKGGGPQGIYYHVSFYDLQAANHITMLPNSVDFVNDELEKVMENDGADFWIINCSNVKPHAYFLDVIRKKWLGQNISDQSHATEFVQEYYGGNRMVAQCFVDYAADMIKFGSHEDERAGEQFYTENARIIAHYFIKGQRSNMEELNWLVGGDFYEQVRGIYAIVEEGLDGLRSYYQQCIDVSRGLSGGLKLLFDTNVLLQSQIHYYCAQGLLLATKSVAQSEAGNWKEAFKMAGNAAVMFDKANDAMKNSEHGVWQGFYFNECLADVEHTAYMMCKKRGVIREFGDDASHSLWHRDTYSVQDRDVRLLLFTEKHYTDEELYIAIMGGNQRAIAME